MTRRRALAALLLAAAACRGPSDREALRVVEDYAQRVSEAFRAGDVRIAEGIVGPEEERRLTGLVGAKLDQGVNLDARLVELALVRVERRGESVQVITRERWEYRDRRIGTGEQVGDASVDRYVMRYDLRRRDRSWAVFDTSFEEPPEVGRSAIPVGEVSVMHGIETRPPDEAAQGGRR